MDRLDVIFHRTFISPFKSHLIIDGSRIEYGNKTINFGEITHIQYGILQMIINGIPMNRIFQVSVKTADPKRKITISLQAIGLFKKWYAKKEALYLQIVSHLWPVTRRLANEALKLLQTINSIE